MTSLLERKGVETAKMHEHYFLKIDAFEALSDKKSMEIQKSYWALKLLEIKLPVDQFLRQLQAFAEKSE